MTEQDAETPDESEATESDVDTLDSFDVDVADADLDGRVDELADAVADADDETVARTLAALHVRVETLADDVADLQATVEEREEEVDDLTSRLKRKQADFQNYKKRVEKRREEEKRRATEDLVTRLLDVRDNLSRALEQDADADVRDGVEATFRELDRVFEDEGVTVVDPEPGEEVDPQRHEVLMRVDSDHPEGTVADVHRPGYVMGEKVLREAQVTVSDAE